MPKYFYHATYNLDSVKENGLDSNFCKENSSDNVICLGASASVSWAIGGRGKQYLFRVPRTKVPDAFKHSKTEFRTRSAIPATDLKYCKNGRIPPWVPAVSST